MNRKILFLFGLIAVLILNACAPVVSAATEELKPAPIIDATGSEALEIDDVQVEVGVGSPRPVFVHVSGSLPDTCSQVEYSEIKQDGSNFIITLSTLAGSSEDCIKDSLPFRMSFPLNIIDLPAGKYSVEVNGSRAEFELESGNPSASLRTADMPVLKDDIKVDSVNVEVGVGSPIPVKAVVSGNLPSACARLGEIRLHRDGTTFFIRLLAHLPAQTDCAGDSIPFRLELPLNIVNMPEGPYEVNVNGSTASFDPHTVSAAAKVLHERNLIPVEHVEVQVGVGSPIPVEIVASGTWPELCAQISDVESEINGFEINVTVLASTVEACPPDRLGLPFRFALPLNVVEMEAGTYSITVNGVSTTLDLPVQQ